MHLKIDASGDVIIDRDLFLNLGRVQNLSLDLRGILPKSKPPVIVEESEETVVEANLQELKSKVIRPTAKPIAAENPDQLGNPVTSYSPNHPRAVFLDSLRIGNAAWDCTCDGIG